MRTSIIVFVFLVILTSCNFSKSVKVDLLSGLSTTGDQLSCGDVYLSANGQKVNFSTFPYGERFHLNFSDLKGLKAENGKVFPDLAMFVLDRKGDTILQARDLYKEYSDGIDSSSPVDLYAKLTAANPIHSDQDYTLFVKIHDKKGKGSFVAKLDFKVSKNQKLNIEANKISYSELYLFSKGPGEVITDNKIKVNETLYFVFEGVSGFSELNGKVHPGLSIIAAGNDGVQIFKYDDLFADSSESGQSASDFRDQVLPNVTFTSAEVKNPVHCTIVLWDKKSEAKITVNTDVEVTQ
jgi:hypothetical protein